MFTSPPARDTTDLSQSDSCVEFDTAHQPALVLACSLLFPVTDVFQGSGNDKIGTGRQTPPQLCGHSPKVSLFLLTSDGGVQFQMCYVG